MEITTDNWPQEIGWTLIDESGTEYMTGGFISGIPYVTKKGVYVASECVPAQDYSFIISDKYGDGIYSPGGYKVFVDGKLVGSGYDYGRRDEVTITRCPDNTAAVSLSLRTDWYGEETSFAFFNSNGVKLHDSTELNNGDPLQSRTLYVAEPVCIARDCYKFIIQDTWGDGICCDYGNGFYRISYDDQVVEGGEFAGKEVREFGDCGATTVSSMRVDLSDQVPKGEETTTRKGKKMTREDKEERFAKAEKKAQKEEKKAIRRKNKKLGGGKRKRRHKEKDDEVAQEA